LEYAVNEFGQPVIYIVNYVYLEHNVRQRSFEVATTSLKEAEEFVGTSTCFEILEQNMLTREQAPLNLIKRQREQKEMLVSLYKSGFKRKAFEGLDIRKPFQEQLDFPIAPEMDKATQQRQKLAMPV
jgi:hypothetical protein